MSPQTLQRALLHLLARFPLQMELSREKMELRLDKHRAFFNGRLDEYKRQLQSMEDTLQTIRRGEPTNVGVNLAAVEAPYTDIAARFEVRNHGGVKEHG